MLMIHFAFRSSAIALVATIGAVIALAGCGGGASSTLPTVAPARTLQSSNATRALGLSVNRAVDSQSAYAQTVLNDAPIVYYPLADTTSTLTDLGPHHFGGNYGSGVARGVPSITLGPTAAARFPGGSSFNPNGYASVQPNHSLQQPHISLEAWFSLNAGNNSPHDVPLVVYGTLDRFIRYGLFVHSMGDSQQCLLYQQHNSGSASVTKWSVTRLKVGQIYHVVTVSDGESLKIYINGVLDASVAFAGSVDYSQPPADGLQIGGADQPPKNAGASFPGTIAQVAVYGTALGAARVSAHYLAGQLVPLVSEKPVESDAFVNSIGVNVHFDNPTLPYATNFARVQSLLVSTGIRHIREALVPRHAMYFHMMTELAAGGVRASYLTNLSLTQSDIQDFPASVGSSFEQYEAPNEQDDVGNANWLSDCKRFQAKLYAWVKNDPKTARYPILGPALTRSSSFTAVGNLSSELDYGNIHDYFSLFNPGTGGWGGDYPPYGVYGSIDYNMNLGRVVSGSKPIMSTETGYGSIPNGNGILIDYRTDLRYMTRLFFEQFNAGLIRTYSYELIDAKSGGAFGAYGLLQTDLTPKPAYYGVKSIIDTLRDPGSSFTTTPLTYRLTGFVNAAHHTLLQKRDGSYVLAIWLELPSWATKDNVGGDIVVPPQTVTLTTDHRFSSQTLTTMADDGNVSTAALTQTGNDSTFDLTDKVSFITLKP